MPHEQPESSSTRRHVVLALKLAVSIILLVVLFSRIDVAQLWETARLASVPWLLAAIAVFGMSTVIGAWRWNVLLKAQHVDIPLPSLLGTFLVATYFNNFLPSNIGGDVIRVRDSSRLTGSTTTSLAVVAIDRILGLGALYALALAAYVLGGPSVRHLAGARLVLVGLGLVFGGMAYVFFRPGIARRVVSASGLARFPWALKRFETVQAAVHVYRQQVAAVWVAFLGSVALQTIVIFYYYYVARALRVPLPLSACFLMVPLCSLVQTVPISFNGWGLREQVYILYFSQVGLPRDGALAFSLVGAGLIVLMSLSGAVVWTSRGAAAAPAP